jgi:hypothetical protein
MAYEGQCCLNLAETWVSNLLKLNAEKGHEILPQIPPLKASAKQTSHLLFFHYPWNPGQAPRKTNKQIEQSKIPEPDVSVPYLLKLSEGYGLALLLRA